MRYKLWHLTENWSWRIHCVFKVHLQDVLLYSTYLTVSLAPAYVPEGNPPNCWHLLTCLNKLFMRSVIQNEGHWISTSFSTLNISTAAFLVRVSAWTWSQSGWILEWKIIKSVRRQTPRSPFELVQDNEPPYLVVLKNRCALGGWKKTIYRLHWCGSLSYIHLWTSLHTGWWVINPVLQQLCTVCKNQWGI